MKRGLILMNVGSPEEPSEAAVAKYLREFLMDPWVIQLPYLLRAFLVKVLIVPKRAARSADAYQKIWSSDGSPLIATTRKFSSLLQQKLGESWQVEFCMRYGRPNVDDIASAQSTDVSEWWVAPMYPQYAEASTRTAVEKIQKVLKGSPKSSLVKFLDPFYSDPLFIQSWVKNIHEAAGEKKWDALLLSYHGLPENQVRKLDSSGAHCGSPGCCERKVDFNRLCYRHHCYETSRLITDGLRAAGLAENFSKITTSFQSRLGVRAWIKPYTDFVLPELRASGVERLLVACPSFVTDCLETLEEIAIRLRATFLTLGGKELAVVPCLNVQAHWVDAFAEIVRKQSEGDIVKLGETQRPFTAAQGPDQAPRF